MDSTDITIIPTMNPDGFDRGKEGECSGTDYKSGRLNDGRSNEFWAAYYLLFMMFRKYRPKPQLPHLG